MLPSPEQIERRYQRLRPLGIAWIERLKELGVSVDALCEPELPARARVIMLADRFIFDFEGEGDGRLVDATLFLARDTLGYPVDIVAWEPKSNRLASWYSRAALLGEDDLFAPRLGDDQALPVHETPVQWLLSERQGVVIIDPRRAAPHLRDAEPLKAHSAAFGLRLANLINPKPPRILAPSGSNSKAA